MPEEFKPNIYPLIFWGIIYGVPAGLLVLAMQFLSNMIGIVWGPVFLLGLAWGAFRNYQKQKETWLNNQGQTYQPQSIMQEFRSATQDIMNASQEVMQQPDVQEPPMPEQPTQPTDPNDRPTPT